MNRSESFSFAIIDNDIVKLNVDSIDNYKCRRYLGYSDAKFSQLTLGYVHNNIIVFFKAETFEPLDNTAQLIEYANKLVKNIARYRVYNGLFGDTLKPRQRIK